LRTDLGWVGLTMVTVLLQGCYLLKQTAGQLDLRLHQIPIAAALEKETDPERRRLLAEIPHIQAFAQERLQLKPSENYTAYYATDEKAIAYVVTACPPDRLEPHTWWFPIIGDVPYKGFFAEPDARKLEADLQRQGLDTWVFTAPAYSTLGWFRDPVTTPMLRNGVFALAETLIHEMTHETLYINGQGHFNEQLASFVGEQGALQYVREYRILSAAELVQIRQAKDRHRQFALMVREAIKELETLYGRKLAREQMLIERQAIFARLTDRLLALRPQSNRERWIFNNARILQYQRYESESELIQDFWHQSGHDWTRFWEMVRAYAAKL